MQPSHSVNHTLILPLLGNTSEIRLAVYRAKDSSVLALGNAGAPGPQVADGRAYDISVPLRTPGGAPSGRVLLVVSYTLPIPKPVV